MSSEAGSSEPDEGVATPQEGFRGLSRAEVAHGLEMADLGRERVRYAESLSLAAAQGRAKLARLESLAETGWAYCVWHGHVHSVDMSGRWVEVGLCEACFKEKQAQRSPEVGAPVVESSEPPEPPEETVENLGEGTPRIHRYHLWGE